MKNKSKKILILICSATFCSYAQQGAVSAGGSAIGSGGSSSFSTGQIDYTSQSGTGGFVSQGNQQPFEIVTLGTDDLPEVSLGMTAYPNPTNDILHLTTTDEQWNGLSYQLYDINGRTMGKVQKVTTADTFVPVDQLPQGVYILNIISDNKTLKTFKIIKNN